MSNNAPLVEINCLANELDRRVCMHHDLAIYLVPSTSFTTMSFSDHVFFHISF